MTADRLAFVSFQPCDGKYVPFLAMEAIISSDRDIESLLQEATNVYQHSIERMKSLLREIQAIRDERKLLPARNIWKLGDVIFELVANLEKLSIQIDGLYNHLVRDLGVKRKWLEKVVIFRRYLPKQDLIPASLNWGRCEKGTKRVAERLRKGLSLD